MNFPSAPRARSVFAEVEGLAMHAVVWGRTMATGLPRFVLVPGLGLSGRYMMPTAELLASTGTVWVPDLPGCGRSDRPRNVSGIPELADALALWMEMHGIEAPVLIGNSFGAQVIVDFAVRYPERLDSAVLVAPPSTPMHPDFHPSGSFVEQTVCANRCHCIGSR